MKEFIKIHQNDNVAVALTPLSANRTLDVDGTEVTLREDIPQGHKFALTDIPAMIVLLQNLPRQLLALSEDTADRTEKSASVMKSGLFRL